jgi:hypothetical protein
MLCFRHILTYLELCDLLNMGQACKTWSGLLAKELPPPHLHSSLPPKLAALPDRQDGDKTEE